MISNIIIISTSISRQSRQSIVEEAVDNSPDAAVVVLDLLKLIIVHCFLLQEGKEEDE